MTHDGVKGYVRHKHGGAWAEYMGKWQRQHTKVKAIHAKGQGIKISSTGQILKDQQLNAYIANLAQRVEINQCLAQEKSDPKFLSRKKIRATTWVATPYGEGVNAYRDGDFKAARGIWLPIAIDGNPKAQNALGYLYRMGLGVTANIATSRQWYAKSAASGDPVGLFSLGDIARKTAGSLEEVVKAITLINKAAMQNYAPAQLAMGEFYKKGEGLPANNSKAYFWATLALKNNYKKAKPLLKQLEATISAADKLTQSSRAENWLARLES
ncbi:MAG: sel1 repeat family protein [Rhodospirillales bacterium]|nr:sel1 repeat family protein [Rhodospirillales bacterium]